MVSIALSSQGRGKSSCLICILVSYLPFWRRHDAQFVKVYHKPVEAEVVQKVGLHERAVFRINVFSLLQPCRPTSVGKEKKLDAFLVEKKPP
jgi:hypothetical protein